MLSRSFLTIWLLCLVSAIARVGVVLAIITAFPAYAQQSRISDYERARDVYFWRQLYVFGGETVYCGVGFGPQKSLNVSGQALTVEHAYPADWIAEAMGCENRNSCALSAYGFAEGDLHNLWPALSSINSSRSDLPFGLIDPDARRFDDFCPDFERTSGANALVEPRDDVKGDLARSILYMSDAYGLPLHGLNEMLLDWHRSDPPDEMERWRNYVIERLQGNRNPFIDGLLLW